MGVAHQQWTFKKIICKKQSGDKNHVEIVHLKMLIREKNMF